MKKVLVLAALLTMVAAPAMAASIVNSAHDLSGLSTYTSKADGTTQFGSTDTDRLCVFCHTPHGATAQAPLWNRGEVTFTGALAAYSDPGGTMQSTPDYTVGDTKLCMTCHDGDLSDDLTNLDGAATTGGLTADVGNSKTLTIPAGATAFIGGLTGENFADDHPVGMVYDNSVATGDVGLRAPATTYAPSALAPNALLRGSGGDEVWCSSCHDVHDPGTDVTGKAPFLRTPNDQSKLCMTCHMK